jgi:hypothetical protein
MTCSVEGCDRIARARGWCKIHWQRWSRTGSTDVRPQRIPPKPQCSIEGCDEPVEGHGWCNKHYLRWRRHGDPQTKLVGLGLICSVEDCEAPVLARGWCSMHWQRWENHGTTDRLRDEESGSYAGAHFRVARVKGPARDCTCAMCLAPAAEWAYDHDDPDELRDDHGVFSLDPAHYMPLCKRCHYQFDQVAA